MSTYNAIKNGYRAQTRLVDISLGCKALGATREDLEAGEFPTIVNSFQELIQEYETFSGQSYDDVTPGEFLDEVDEYLSPTEQAGLALGLYLGRQARKERIDEAQSYFEEHLGWPEL